MGSQDSVTGPHGDTFSFPRIMDSQDSVTGPYCLWRHTLFPCNHGQQRLRHRAKWRNIFLPQDNGQSRFRHWSVLFIEVMGSNYSVTGPNGHTFPSPRSWAVKTPSPGHMATHSPSPG
ncbi:hypothetical protein Bpfe_002355 [Biomphalaria pfeifferi]|uniref:Uncharacterized protein n=1 Tax=Biomphalaria pfeifferi TaxID=112525 RepID=A0AAD8FL80_BIOPF|nr:hypothetical protein Bpfe_002355 [Biomphalaria pfeifferi]